VAGAVQRHSHALPLPASQSYQTVMPRSLFFLLVAVIALFLQCVQATDEAPSDVLELDGESFEKAIADNDLIAVEFFSPWCGHCKSLAPEWEKAATAMKGKVPVAKVDCTANQELCGAQGVQGYPTLKLFRGGEAGPMEVARKSEAIVTFLSKELSPAVTTLSTSAEVDAFVAEHPLTAVAFLDNDHDDRWTAFNSVALKKRHSLDFVAVIKADWAKHTAPALVLYRNFDEPQVVYEGEFSSAPMSLWISRSLLPTLGEISVDTFPSYMAAELKTLGYLFVDPNDASTATFLKELEPKLAPYKDDFVVAWINNNRYAQQATRLGLSTKIPSLALDNHQDGIRFVFPDEKDMTVESLAEWFADFKSGKLAPFVKSEPIPESNDTPVKVIVAHSFKDIVHDETKDVLVEFYAPWCGHCKNLAPIWEELGSLFASTPSVVIAKIDATANDVPPKLNIRGFPTILYFPAQHKDAPVEYQGPRSLEDLAKFVQTHADTKFEAPAAPQQDEDEEDDHDHDHEKDEL
jgi:protein disulfide-isomerase A1